MTWTLLAVVLGSMQADAPLLQPGVYVSNCHACAAAPVFDASALEAFAYRTRGDPEANAAAAELVYAHRRSRRLLLGGAGLGLGVALAGVLAVPSFCTGPNCTTLNETNGAVMGIGVGVAALGASLYVLCRPKEREFVSQLNAWNTSHPDERFEWNTRTEPGVATFPGRGVRASGSLWKEPLVWGPAATGVLLGAGSLWFVHRSATLDDAFARGELQGREQVEDAVVSGSTANAAAWVLGIASGVSFGAAGMFALEVGFNDVSVEPSIGPGGFALSGRFP